jgi:hypothetical protein
MTAYGDRLRAGHYAPNNQPQPDQELDPNKLPGRHADLDGIATARGITWSGEELTVADKQERLKAALEQ